MEVHLREIPKEGRDLAFEVDRASLRLSEKTIDIEGLVQVRFSLFRQAASIYLRGNIQGRTVQDCSRCLGRVSRSLDLDVQAEYQPERNSDTPGEVHLKRDELDVMTYDGPVISFRDLIREQIILSAPIHVLCKSDCRGRCPRCAEDLNQVQCACPVEEPDGHFSELKDYWKNPTQKRPRGQSKK